MLALYDHPSLRLPYRAAAPWPLVEHHGQIDWIESVYTVESWLESTIGPHYREWCWDTWALHNSSICAVSFKLEKYSTLFLLRYSDQLSK
jgi:hypothetical protein